MPWPYWFELAVVFGLTAVGNILLGHFEAGRPKWRRVLKVGLAGALAVAVSASLGRSWFFALLGALLVTVVVIHAWWLPRHGVNGWTGEPRERYYRLRGWKM
ncbi:MAG: DUF2207 domain-containing protein [Verrucomicrobia bacterium]|nr:DUF2207 domain-containing protein [Verrucomicrobiota bacterium]